MGLYYFTKLMARFEDVHLALMAYNYGPTYVERRIRQGALFRKDIPIVL